MKVTFCGHSQVAQTDEVRSWLRDSLEMLIKEGADTFYLGGYGEFDHMAASLLREAKKSHPHLVMTLVLPYLDSTLDASGYDGTLYPPLEKVPRRFAISKRNQWMASEADVTVAYVVHGWGGAAQTLLCAQRKKKRIIQYLSA